MYDLSVIDPQGNVNQGIAYSWGNVLDCIGNALLSSPDAELIVSEGFDGRTPIDRGAVTVTDHKDLTETFIFKKI